MSILGYDHGPRGVGVRHHVVVIPSVGCTNRTVELVGRSRPAVRYLTHQHGCAQLGDDLRTSREVLARACANPNVAAVVVVGLGCETNQSDTLVGVLTELGTPAVNTVLQGNGGLDATVIEAQRRADEFLTQPATRRPLTAADLRVALLHDDEEAARSAACVEIALRQAGIGVELVPVEDDESTGAAQATDRITSLWQLPMHPLLSVDVDRLSSSNAVEALALAAARGAHICVFLSGQGNPVGSPIVPTLKVNCSAALSGHLEGIADLDGATMDDEQLADAVREMVLAVAAGQPVAAEVNGQRDFGLPRIAPSM
jgi:altronate dehydratase large subunit